MKAVRFQPFFIYRDASALGHLLYQAHPTELIEPAALSQLHPTWDAGFWADRAVALGLPPLRPLQQQLRSGRPLRFAFSGDRIALAECLLGQLPPEIAKATSFSTSLVPSSDRPFMLTLVNETSKSNRDGWK